MIHAILVLFFAVIATVYGQNMPGGWRSVDTTSPEMTDITLFAINAKYPGGHPRFFVVEAKKQVSFFACIIIFF